LIALAGEITEDSVHNWRLKILKDKFVTLKGEHVSMKLLEKSSITPKLSRGKEKNGAIPPKESAQFVADMEKGSDSI
jgi:hypothetical protein